jgi:hypothetical protein
VGCDVSDGLDAWEVLRNTPVFSRPALKLLDGNNRPHPGVFHERVRTHMKTEELTFALAGKSAERVRNVLKGCVLCLRGGAASENAEIGKRP